MGVDRSIEGKAQRLPALQILAYLMPSLPLAALGLPVVVHLPQFYASQEMGMSLATAGLVFSLCRIADVFIDPMMGYLSDRWRTRWGRRRPLIVLGTPLLAMGIWMLFLPGGPVSPLHLSIWLFLMYLGWSMVTIPHTSWGAELSGDYHERSRIYGWSQFAIILGMVGVLVVPVIVDHIGGYPQLVQIEAMGVFALVLLAVAIPMAVFILPEAEVKLATHAPLWATLKFVFTDGALRRVIGLDLVASTLAGVIGALFFFFARFALDLPNWAGTLLLAYFVSGIACVPFWIWLSRRVGKARALQFSFVYGMCIMALLFLVPPHAFLPALAVFCLSGANYGAATFLLRSMMADINDVDAAQNGAERAGMMYSLLALTNKFGIGWAVGIAFGILAWLGFDPKTTNSAASIEHLRLFFIFTPLVLNTLNLWILSGYPLDEQRQRAIRLEVERRRAGHVEVSAAIVLDEARGEEGSLP